MLFVVLRCLLHFLGTPQLSKKSFTYPLNGHFVFSFLLDLNEFFHGAGNIGLYQDWVVIRSQLVVLVLKIAMCL